MNLSARNLHLFHLVSIYFRFSQLSVDEPYGYLVSLSFRFSQSSQVNPRLAAPHSAEKLQVSQTLPDFAIVLFMEAPFIVNGYYILGSRHSQGKSDKKEYNA